MSKQKIIKDLIGLDFNDISSLSDEFSKTDSSQDILYRANCVIFESSNIDHKNRLLLLKKVRQICLNNKNSFCTAHNLTLSIKVSRELGQDKDLIKISHKAIELWKTILDQPLAINGLIFAYIDLGLIFSDFNLNSLAMRYLERAESLLSECDNNYNPSVKLYVAYAVICGRAKNYKKSNSYYNQVIDMAESRKDSRTLIPVLVNMSDHFIMLKYYGSALKKSNKALKISNESNDNIYKPYIYNTLGHIYLNNSQYEKSKKYLDKASKSFKGMSVIKMIPQNQYSLGRVFYKQKKYNTALSLFNEALDKNKKSNNFELDVKIFKKILEISKQSKDEKLFLSTSIKLNKALEKQIKNKEKVFSETSSNALKYLIKEFDISLIKQRKLKLKIDIESKQRKLTTNALISVSEREFLRKIIDGISSNRLENKKIIQLCRQRIQDTKDWNIFMKLFNDIHPYFNKYIIKKCPSITESELRVCNLIKMGFSSLEIAEILSISKRGIEQHRYRIRKKLDLKIDLSIFIQSL